MKVKDLIEELQKLDQNNNIFLRNFMMCDEFEINQITKEEVIVWNKWINATNIWDYYISESDDWSERNTTWFKNSFWDLIILYVFSGRFSRTLFLSLRYRKTPCNEECHSRHSFPNSFVVGVAAISRLRTKAIFKWLFLFFATLQKPFGSSPAIQGQPEKTKNTPFRGCFLIFSWWTGRGSNPRPKD